MKMIQHDVVTDGGGIFYFGLIVHSAVRHLGHNQWLDDINDVYGDRAKRQTAKLLTLYCHRGYNYLQLLLTSN